MKCADVRFVKELYPRLKPHDDVVERYRDALDQLPPIVVARGGVLVDGYHRWQAHVREDVEDIAAEDLGDLTDAEIIRESVKRNASHGQQLTRADKQRIAAAKAHEGRVLRSLKLRGWTAEPFGQGQLSEDIRAVLRTQPTHVRWMPDIIAAKVYSAKARVVFIDAIAGEKFRETGNHDIESAALDAAEQWIKYSNDLPYYFVFHNGDTATPSMVRELSQPGSWRGNGSGTPFVLFPVISCQSFDAVFGAAIGATA